MADWTPRPAWAPKHARTRKPSPIVIGGLIALIGVASGVAGELGAMMHHPAYQSSHARIVSANPIASFTADVKTYFPSLAAAGTQVLVTFGQDICMRRLPGYNRRPIVHVMADSSFGNSPAFAPIAWTDVCLAVSGNSAVVKLGQSICLGVGMPGGVNRFMAAGSRSRAFVRLVGTDLCPWVLDAR